MPDSPSPLQADDPRLAEARFRVRLFLDDIIAKLFDAAFEKFADPNGIEAGNEPEIDGRRRLGRDGVLGLCADRAGAQAADIHRRKKDALLDAAFPASLQARPSSRRRASSARGTASIAARPAGSNGWIPS